MNYPAPPNDDAPHSDDSSALPDPLAEDLAELGSVPSLLTGRPVEKWEDCGDDGWSLWRLIERQADGTEKWRYIGLLKKDGEWDSTVEEKPKLGRLPKAMRPSRKVAKLGSIPRNRGKPAKSAGKSGKLSVSKSSGKRDSWTVTADDKTTFRIRLTESGYSVVLRWREPDGKRPERYCCYLSKSEWSKAKQGSLSAFVQTVALKVDVRIAAGEGGSSDLTDVLRRIRAFT